VQGGVEPEAQLIAIQNLVVIRNTHQCPPPGA
jgi:hypothetical protein